jgi:glycosyltransferase involved in cell wall biosynthesis
MRIALEMMGLVPGQVGGMETYVRQLLAALARLDAPHEYLVLVGREAKGLAPRDDPRFTEFVADTRAPRWLLGVRSGQSLWQWRAAGRELARWKHDVLHCTLHVPRPAWGARNMVLTLPDLNFEEFPDLWTFKQRTMLKVHCRLGARLARRIITLSEYARRCIVDRYRVPADRIDVVPCGVDGELFRPEKEAGEDEGPAPWPREPFLFYPANTWPHKNHPRLLEALALLRDRHGLTVPLVLTGAEKHGHRDMMTAAERLWLTDQVRWLGYLDRRQLAACYRAATALVFPSLHEGFGIPVVEAMASGCPVACSSTTATGEVAADAALTFEPRDPEAMTSAIRALLTDESLRRGLAAKGLQRATLFTWERCVLGTMESYEKLIGIASGTDSE